MQSKQIIRNNTSFPIQITAKLRDLYDKYKEELEDNAPNDDILSWAKNLKYYQYLIKELILNDSFTENEYARGLLVYHTMGMGKTRLAVSVAMSCWNIYQPVVLLPQGLKKNFKKTIEDLLKLINNNAQISQQDIKNAINKFQFVSMDAYNSSTQMENIKKSENDIPLDTAFKAEKKKLKSEKKKLKSEKKKLKAKKKAHGGNLFQNGLDNKLLIVDEAHNFFRSIINSGSENSNAKKIYEIIMTAKNLKILFLTGTPCAKDPFELVPCFNMLTGKNLLPTSYEIFYSAYVDKATNSILNKNKLANRLLGLVSHVTHNKSSEPKTSNKKEIIRQNRDSGWFPECKPLIVSYISMSSPQYKQYLLVREKENAEKGRGMGKGDAKLLNPTPKPLALPNSENQTMGSYYVKSRMLSNFAPPREYIDSTIEDIPKNLFNKQTSPKLSLIADRVHDAKGSVLVYSQFVDRGGLKPLTKFLENRNFTEFNISNAMEKYSHILKSKKIKSDAMANEESDAMANEDEMADEENNDLAMTDGESDDLTMAYEDEMEDTKINDLTILKTNAMANTKIKSNDFKLKISSILKEIDNINIDYDLQELDSKEISSGGCLNTCPNTSKVKHLLTNKEFEQVVNTNEKQLILMSQPKTYVIYGAHLYFSQLRERLKDWEEIHTLNTEKIVDFAWGNILPSYHHDVNFFNQKAKLKNILMNSKSIITNKGKLYKTFFSFMERGKYIPKTYNLQDIDIQYLQKHKGGGKNKKNKKKILIQIDKNNPYIVKDSTSFGQKGVHIITSLEELEIYQHNLKHTLGIISEYLINPLLWNGKKFHFRIYVGVYVNSNGTRKVKIFNNSNYAFKVFIAKENYKPNHFDNIDMHITGLKSTLMRHQWHVIENAAMSKDATTDADFYFLESNLPPNTTFKSINSAIETMFDQLITPILPKFEIYPECEAGFEIFGADVMLDDKGNPYVLEINAKIGYSEDHGQQAGQIEFHKAFSHDFFNWVVNEFILIE